MRNASRLSMTAGWVALALLGVLGLGGAAARPDGVSLGLPAPVPLALLAVAFVVLGAFARGSKGFAACLGLGLVPLLLLSGLHVPGLDAVSGRPLLALLLAGVAVVLSAAGRGLGRAAFLPCVVILYAGVAAGVQLQVGPEGDEPHYLMVADSILRDADLSLEPDYAEGRYAAFYPKPLKPHYRVRGQNGEIFSRSSWLFLPPCWRGRSAS